MQPRIHDLLEIDTRRFLEAHTSAPAWVTESLQDIPFVVVRRGDVIDGAVAIGVRGPERNQRWAGSCDHRWINRVATPRELVSAVLAVAGESPGPYTLSLSRLNTIPALRALALLSRHDAWKTLPHPWGPGGSVGFEVATGHPTASSQSDLDIVIYAEHRLSPIDAQHLQAATQNLPAAVDVRVETPTCGFSLAEYASHPDCPILLRFASGVMLGADPWAVRAPADSTAVPLADIPNLP